MDKSGGLMVSSECDEGRVDLPGKPLLYGADPSARLVQLYGGSWRAEDYVGVSRGEFLTTTFWEIIGSSRQWLRSC